MKKLFVPLLAIVALSTLAFTHYAIEPLAIGSGLPEANTKLTDVSGKEVTLAGSKKKNGLLVIFSCNTCPYVIKNQERNNEMCAYAEKNNIGVVIVNSNEAQRNDADSYDAMKKYAADQGYKWNYAVDKNSTLADAFGATKTPEIFLFNKDSKLVYHGAFDDSPSSPKDVSRKHLQVAIDEAVAGKEVSVKTSKSVGCGIKRVK